MNHQDPRENLIQKASDQSLVWDIIVIGGGASGLNAAWDAVSRGLKVALIEQHDFAKSTSSKSTKLIHGGVRYLQKLEIDLVREALDERKLLLENAAEFCDQLDFVLPCQSFFSRCYYRCGLWLYDLLGRVKRAHHSVKFPLSKMINSAKVRERLPRYNNDKLSGGVVYSDAQFDDAGMAIALAQVINGSDDNNNNGVALNYAKVTEMQTTATGGKHLTVIDRETQKSWEMNATVVINATGVYSDLLREKFGISKQWTVQMSRGAHIVCAGDILGGKSALIVPKTSDGRVLFAIPWMDHTIIGTTDVATEQATSDPQPTAEEMEFLLHESGIALGVTRSDILSQWAGLRPLVSEVKNKSDTKSLSRKHVIEVSDCGLVSVLGGKWTTSRAMGEEAVNVAIKSANLAANLAADASQTASRKLTDHGALAPINNLNIDEKMVTESILHFYARTIDDVLSRRSRLLMLDAKQAISKAPEVAQLMAQILGWDRAKTEQELNDFLRLAQTYLPDQD